MLLILAMEAMVLRAQVHKPLAVRNAASAAINLDIPPPKDWRDRFLHSWFAAGKLHAADGLFARLPRC